MEGLQDKEDYGWLYVGGGDKSSEQRTRMEVERTGVFY